MEKRSLGCFAILQWKSLSSIGGATISQSRKFGCQAGLLVFGNSPAAGRMLLHLLDDFGDIFQVGLCIHQRSLRSTSRELSFRTYRQSHAALSRVGIIWTSGPKDAVWGPAKTRQLQNYGTCLNDYYHIHHLNY